jgi:hypothetical protein
VLIGLSFGLAPRSLLAGVIGAGARSRHLLCCVGLAAVVVLAMAARAHATSLTPSVAFYWNLPALPGNPNDQEGAIAASPDGNLIYVADKYANAIEEYTSDGTLKRLIKFKQPTAPTGVTTDLSGDVFFVYEATGRVAKFTPNLKLLSSWKVPFAKSIAADRAGQLFVLTNFLNSVGEYNSNGKSIGGFVANFPGQYFGFAGYDPPDKTVATEITVDGSGRPVVVGESDQPLANPEPDCHSVIDEPYPYGVDHHPYFDPLVSGEAVRFSASGAVVDYGWLSESDVDCYHGWVNDGYDPGGVAVDPNGGGVYATTETHLAVERLDPSLNNPAAYGGQPPSSEGNLPLPFYPQATTIAGNPPLSVAFDCHSNLYVLTNSNARAVVKYINQDHVPASACSPLLQRASIRPGITVFAKFATKGSGRASVLIGCHVKLCAGTVSLKTASAVCSGCLASFPRHFRIHPGLQQTLSLRLNQRGRTLLAEHPGAAIKIFGKLKNGHTTTEAVRLRQPTSVTDVCSVPPSVDGQASISGRLMPPRAHQKIAVEYVPPAASGVFLPAVQRRVLTDGAGRFSDHYQLDEAGGWIETASWGGDRTHQPATAQPCGGTVQKAPTHVKVTCPSAATIGAPSRVSGTLSGAPADALLAVLHIAPSGTVSTDDVIAGADGSFTDVFALNQPGAWEAEAHYNGDANHAPAAAICQFTVARAPSTLSLQCTPDPNKRFISCTGRLTSEGAAVGQTQIKVSYGPPSGSATAHTATTVQNGTFSDQLNAPTGSLLTSGTWTIRAQYPGDSAHAPASHTTAVTL